MSAPASTATTAWRARFSMVMSFATWPCSITPQWPWSVYSQKQVSGITTSSGAARFALRTMRATRPSRFQASLPEASLWCEMPNSISAFTPSRASPSTACSSLRSGMRETPGISAIGRGSSMPSSMKIGWIRSLAVTAVSRTRARRVSDCRSRRRRVVGNGGDMVPRSDQTRAWFRPQWDT